ncbi:hypothetical protein EHS39_09080 [Ensifer sp. MPMI2T]|nr:hypothetical protein EHS39_09080 [Ensifer sp. MPMI2T]
MAKTTSGGVIDPARMYRIQFTQSFEHAGKKYIPRAGVTHKVRGDIVVAIKDKLDSYEAV